MRIERSQLLEQSASFAAPLAHSDDATAADGDAGLPHAPERLEALVVRARGDDVAVKLRRRIEVVIVCRESGVRERSRLAVRQHAERTARLEAQAAYRANHL